MNLDKIEYMIRNGTNEDILIAAHQLKDMTLADIGGRFNCKPIDAVSKHKNMGLGIEINRRSRDQIEAFYRQVNDDLYICIGTARLIFRDKGGLNGNFQIKEL